METKTEIEIQNSVAKFYENVRYNDISLKWHDWNIKSILRLLNEKKLKGKVLDDGCGNGILSTYINNLYGIDASPDMIRLAKKKMNAILASCESIPFENDTFDIVIAKSLIHHLKNPQKALSEINRVLKQDGEAIFVDPLHSLLSYLPRKIFGSGHFSSDHHDFTTKELLKLLKPFFKIEKIVYFGYISYPLFAFPDIVNLTKFIPAGGKILKVCIYIDEWLAKIPLIKKMAWGIIILVKK